VLIESDRFNQGTTYAAYRERILAEEGVMRDMLTASERALANEEIDVEPFRRLPKPLRVLVLSEDWCGDCTDNLPILNRIAEESGKLDVRIVPRDEHLDVMDQYLKGGEFRSIPLILFLDDDGRVIGAFKERPDSVTELRARKRQELYARRPDFGSPGAYAQLSEETRAELQDALLALREETRSFAIQEVVRELGEIVAGAG
jgi:thioredoxin-like negative regulator of GroEL